VTVTDETSDKHSFRFKWGSMELAAIGLPAVITVALGMIVLALMRWCGLI
jgi:maltodextrin utilization protein YvdJ